MTFKHPFTKNKSYRLLLMIVVLAAVLVSAWVWAASQDAEARKRASKAENNVENGAENDVENMMQESKPALTVTITKPQTEQWPQVTMANGNVAAWQEVIIGAEISGYRLTEVLVSVGDVVNKGQLLARVSSDTITAELEQSKAAVVEAQARLAQARANAKRARQVESAGALSVQQISQYMTDEQAMLARVNAAKAKLQADKLRLTQTRVLAPDDGVISSRSATVGSLAQPGQELFRMIRGNRLEWRAEVTAAELGSISPGMKAHLTLPNGAHIDGEVRIVAPTVDEKTRNAIVYVDLPVESAARAGMFARGEIQLGNGVAQTLPQSAVLPRDGFNYVYQVDGNNRVGQRKVKVGRRVNNRIEIISGLEPTARVVTSGGGFLTDGDTVRVVDTVMADTTNSGMTASDMSKSETTKLNSIKPKTTNPKTTNSKTTNPVGD